MTPAFTITLLWVGFAASHMALSSLTLRPRLVGFFGERPFQGLYSLVALAFFIPLVRVYFANKHAGALLWSLPLGTVLRWALYFGMGIAFVLIVVALFDPGPASVVRGDPRPRGAYLITRHPLFMGLGLFGLLHLVPNGYTTDAAFFAGFPLFALAGGWHQDRRKLATGAPGFADFHAATPFLPFSGRDRVRGLRELSRLGLAAGIGLAIALRYFHAAWF